MPIHRRTAVVIAALAMSSSIAFAQSFPSKPIRLIVPYPAGSGPDIMARLLGESAATRLNQPVVIDNKPGAGGMLGADAAAKAPADGHTLLVGDSGPLSIAPWIYAKVPYSPAKDFIGVASLVSIPLLMIVPANFTANTPNDLVKLAKAKPGNLLYGSLGVGSIHHLAIEVFSSAAGIKMTHVPYKSNAELTVGIVNGDVQMGFSSIPAVEAFIKDRRMRTIGLSTARRSPVMPDVKTVQEQGVPGFDVAPSIGLVAPAGVPADRLKVLEEAFLAALNEPKLAERLDVLGMTRRPASGAAYQATYVSELERFGEVVKAIGLKPQ